MKVYGEAINALRFLHGNEDEDIYEDGRAIYCGNEKISRSVFNLLLRNCFISQDSFSENRFHINETGIKFLSTCKNVEVN